MNSLQRDYYDKIDQKIYQIIKKHNININANKYNIKVIINYLIYTLPEHLKPSDISLKMDYILRLDEFVILDFLTKLPDIESIEKIFYERKKQIYKRLTYYKHTYVAEYYFASTQDKVEKCNEIIKQIDDLIEINRKDKIKINSMIGNLIQ
jgi:hypothetical protein